MKKLTSSQSLSVHVSPALPTQKSLYRWPESRPRYSIMILACVLAISLFCFPAVVQADLADDIAATFEDAINALIGTELGPLTLKFAFKPPDYQPPIGPPVSFDSVHVDVTILGFAFCNPPEKWADPNPTPTFPFNAYGCENVAMVGATATPDATSSEITVTVSDFFLDLEYVRETTDACFLIGGETSGGTHAADAYLLTSGTVTMDLALERVGTCLNASVVPGSVVVTLTEKEHGLQTDECLDTVWPLFSDFFYELINATASTALEGLLSGMMGDINTVLCPLTPVEQSTWGGMKSLYR